VKIFEDLFHKLKPTFSKGGKLEFAYPVFEAVETGFFTPETVTIGKTHIRDGLDSKRLMTTVMYALIPCVLFCLYNTGMQKLAATGAEPDVVKALLYGALAFFPLYAVTFAVGGMWEVLFAIVRKHEVNEGFFVTSLLFPLILPPTLPLWQAAVAISFGVVIGKEVFGGTGMNIVNPALLSRAFLFFSYPASISGEGIWRFIDSSKVKLVDGLTGATPLGVAASVPVGNNVVDALNTANYTFMDLFIGTVPGSMGETSALFCLVGAAILIFTKIASFRTIFGCVIGAVGISFVFNMLGGEGSNPMFAIPPHYHLVLGGFAFGAVFMATDPVSSAISNTGKWIYGILIGIFGITIRVVNPAYPEGMMLAILLMNVFAPVIDHFVAQSNIRRRLSRGQR
jgi:Na+-transporting NADH:ubiquinone oxidoreductase subunit B